MNVNEKEETLNVLLLFCVCKCKKIARKNLTKKFGLNLGYSREKLWECMTH